jgi:hypothetical protein
MGEMEELPGVADMVLQLPFEQLKFSHYTAPYLEVQAISFRLVHKRTSGSNYLNTLRGIAQSLRANTMTALKK